ncbi:MAG: glycoside hydrolase family 16 protein, partial [Cyclobacteriaceae bacterium]
MTTEKLTALLGREFRLLVIISLAVLMIGISACGSDSEMEMKIPPIEGYTLEWSDEFSGNAIDLDNWGFETGDGTDYGLAAGWGNNELQIYTSEEGNASIVKDDGLSVLSITALDDGAGGYTSAKLTTKNKVSIRFGRIDVKAKLPEGQGLWPAIWMLGDNKDEVDWPGCGEIDIMEILGNDP